MDALSLEGPPAAQLARQREALLPALWRVQETQGYISPAAVKEISHTLRIPEAEIYGVISFYTMFFDHPRADTVIQVCNGPVCRVAGAHEAAEHLCTRLGTSLGTPTADNAYEVEHAPCLGLCEHAPAALVRRDGKGWQQYTHIHDADSLLAGRADTYSALLGSEQSYMLGALDPTRAETLAEYGDYAALRHAIADQTPEQVIAEMEMSGLAGRGGAAFPVAVKWRFTRQAEGANHYIICNADESEPGTFKDRVVMELRPHLLLEGMAIAAYAIGATQGYIFIRGEYPVALERLNTALEEAQVAGLLGDNIMGTGMAFHVEIRRGAGAYICGEETALFEAIEGKRGFPRIKPPFPTTHGLFNQPTAINNVETLAYVPLIMQRGGAWFNQLGTDASAGAKLIAVSGHVNRPGVYEVPFGFPLRRLLEDLCGGVQGELQAVLVGGAAGSFLAPDEIDVPLSVEALRERGAALGSGAIMVFNQSVDLRDVLDSVAEFFQHESCGKCYPCQLGTQRQYEIIHRAHAPLPGDRQRLYDIGVTMHDASLCGLGQTAATAVLSALERWPDLFASDDQTPEAQGE